MLLTAVVGAQLQDVVVEHIQDSHYASHVHYGVWQHQHHQNAMSDELAWHNCCVLVCWAGLQDQSQETVSREYLMLFGVARGCGASTRYRFTKTQR